MSTLATRLAVYACKDLAAHCPETIEAICYWTDHAADWLTEVAADPRARHEVPRLIGPLGLALAPKLGVSLPEACRMLKEEMALRQAQRQLTKEAL